MTVLEADEEASGMGKGLAKKALKSKALGSESRAVGGLGHLGERVSRRGLEAGIQKEKEVAQGEFLDTTRLEEVPGSFLQVFFLSILHHAGFLP